MHNDITIDVTESNLVRVGGHARFEDPNNIVAYVAKNTGDLYLCSVAHTPPQKKPAIEQRHPHYHPNGHHRGIAESMRSVISISTLGEILAQNYCKLEKGFRLIDEKGTPHEAIKIKSEDRTGALNLIAMQNKLFDAEELVVIKQKIEEELQLNKKTAPLQPINGHAVGAGVPSPSRR